MNRRTFFKRALLAMPLALAGDGHCMEPTWLRLRKIRIADGRLGLRIAHFSDLHHKGDLAYLRTVVDTLNSLAPDFCCFTGDLVENCRCLPEALGAVAGIKAPVYGVPGNHDYWSRSDFSLIRECLRSTGGDWLLDEQRVVGNGRITLTGSAGLHPFGIPAAHADGTMNLLLIHYPLWANRLGDRVYDLILAGHSHGGQVQIPFIGAPFLPDQVGPYVMGSYNTPAGHLYVNPGIGFISLYDFRFNCRPEITVFEV